MSFWRGWRLGAWRRRRCLVGGPGRLGATGCRAVRRTRRRRCRTWRWRWWTIGRRWRRRWWPVPPMRRRRWRRGWWRRGRLGIAERDCRDRGHCGNADCSGEEVPYPCLDLRGCREDCGGNRRGDDLRGAVDDLVHGWLLSCACDTNNNAQSCLILSRFVLFFHDSQKRVGTAIAVPTLWMRSALAYSNVTKKAAEFLSGLTSVRHPSRQPTSHGKLSRVSSRTMAETFFTFAAPLTSIVKTWFVPR